MSLQLTDHRMADEFCFQSAGLIKRFFKWKDAHHEVKEFRHARHTPPVPGPDLRTDIIDEFPAKAFAAQIGGKAQIEARIVDKNHGSWLDQLYLLVHLVKS